MQKIIDKAIGVIQHELVRSIDEFYEGDELTQNKISKSLKPLIQTPLSSQTSKPLTS